MQLKTLPHSPGVYWFKDNSGKTIYIGKAIDLRNRVSSYFKPASRLLPRTQAMVGKIKDFDYIRVESEIEALILEANLIKRDRPYYNVRLKDDKSYLYIKIDKGDYPKVSLARSRDLADARRSFGPYPNASAARTTYRMLRRIFPFSTCQPNQGKACFYYHIGLCLGVCIGSVNTKDYKKMISRLIKFLEGKKPQVVKDLTLEMTEAAKKLEFERAGQIRRQIEALNYIASPTHPATSYLENPNLLEDLKQESLAELAEVLHLGSRKLSRIEAYDNSNIQGVHATSSMVVFQNGEPAKDQYRKFRIKWTKGSDDYAFFKEVLKRRFRKGRLVRDQSFESTPDLIVIDGGRGQVETAKGVLDELGLAIPVIGLAKRLEEIYFPGIEKPLRLPGDSAALKLLQHLRDEAHRFALSYHRYLRRRALLPDKFSTAKLGV